MSPLNALGVLKDVRANTATRDTSFILMSSHKEANSIVFAKKAGADSMLTKPFTTEVLKIKIKLLSRN